MTDYTTRGEDRRKGPRRESEQRAHLARELIIEKARGIVAYQQSGTTVPGALDAQIRDLSLLLATLDDAEDTIRMEAAR